MHRTIKSFIKKWSGRRGSNPRPPPWQGDALPAELLPLDANQSNYYINIFFAKQILTS